MQALVTPERRSLRALDGPRRTGLRGLEMRIWCTGNQMKERKPPENPGSDDAMDTRPTTMTTARASAALGRDIQAKIGQQLRSYYDSLDRADAGPVRRSAAPARQAGQGRRRMSLDPATPRADSRGGPEPPRLRHFAVRQRRPRRRSGAGDAAARARQHPLVPARHQHAGVAVHDPAQPVPFGIPQAPARGRGCRRQLCRDAEDRSRSRPATSNSRNSAWR